MQLHHHYIAQQAMASAIPSLLFCLILAAAHLGSSYHTSYSNGGKHFVVLSSDPRSPSTCSPVPSGEVPCIYLCIRTQNQTSHAANELVVVVIFQETEDGCQ